MDHEWMTIQEVADFYRRPVKTLYGWRYRGFGPPAVLLGGKLLYRRTAVERWILDLADSPREAVGGHA